MPTCPQEKEEVIMDNAINKLFEFYDTKFFERKIEVDSDGKYGLNYDGLCFDTYIENSIYDIDYLSIEDYFMIRQRLITMNVQGYLNNIQIYHWIKD